MEKGTLGMIVRDETFPNPITEHVAESQWQSCDCRTCQSRRALIMSVPGSKFDFATFRHKDERY